MFTECPFYALNPAKKKKSFACRSSLTVSLKETPKVEFLHHRVMYIFKFDTFSQFTLHGGWALSWSCQQWTRPRVPTTPASVNVTDLSFGCFRGNKGIQLMFSFAFI